MVYAKTINPEWFDYRCYEDDFNENVMVDGGKDYCDINGDDLKSIKKLINDYQCYDYEYYYQNSIKAYLVDMLPKKKNGKKLSPKEISIIKKALDEPYRYYSDYEQSIIITCLSIIYGEPYKAFGLRGCCQGEYVKLYAPTNTRQDYVDYLEAIFFGTGTEIMIHDEDSEVTDPEEICGYSIYTALYSDKDLKNLVAKECGVKEEDVVLFKYVGYHKVEDYERC